MESATGGWYNGRRQYRSVAFGTWQVGGARILTARKLNNNESSSTANQLSPLETARRMGESSPNLCSNRLHPTNTQRSLGALPSYSVDQRLGLAPAQDCYSSSEYVAYTERRGADTGNGASEPIQAAFRGQLTSERRARLENSLQRVHYRSASAGADASYSIRASTSEMKSPLALTRENTRFLRATKKFFKKIYNSATLPNNNKREQKAASVEPRRYERVDFPADPIWVPPPSIRMVDDDIEDDHTSRIDSYCGSSPATDSGVDVDRSSTPDHHSVESITVTTKSEEDDELSYNEIFENLRREMQLLRQRDHKILAELHWAEEQLRTARRGDRFAVRGFPV